MQYLGFFITTLFLTIVVGSPTDCRETFQTLIEEAITVKKSCNQATYKDCCQVNIMHLNTGNTLKSSFSDQKNCPMVSHWQL